MKLVAMCFLATCLSFAEPPTPQFTIRDFTVRVQLSTVRINGHQATATSWNELAHPSTGSPARVSGSGSVTLAGNTVHVTFTNITLVRENAGHQLVATSGVVSGRNGHMVSFLLGQGTVNIDPGTIAIRPQAARAAATVIMPLTSVCGGPDTRITLRSDACSISADGSVDGDDFRGEKAFHLRNMPDSVIISDAGEHKVHLHQKGVAHPGSIPYGVILTGKTLRKEQQLFTCTIHLTGSGAVVVLTLTGPVQTTPEMGYALSLTSGSDTLTYGRFRILSSRGRFAADIIVPDPARTQGSPTFQVHSSALSLDTAGGLCGFVTMPGTKAFTLSRTLRIDPGDSGWVYFPQWFPDRTPITYVRMAKLDCPGVYEQLRATATRNDSSTVQFTHRPGLTMTRGTVHLRCPQTDADSLPGVPYNLKSSFLGVLTFTPWGITGDLGTCGWSFVPERAPIEESKRIDQSRRPSWQEILAATVPPPELSPRFTLSGLRIMAMHLDTLRLCANTISKKDFRYVVHFPFPSYIRLAFRDTTLNDDGCFLQAVGPVTDAVWSSRPGSAPAPLTPGSSVPAMKNARVLPAPDEAILWAWRLPVSFAPRGVTIDHDLQRRKADVRVRMTLDQLTDSAEVISSEIWVPPLYSSNSAFRKGVRFSATLDPSGGFALTRSDSAPHFAAMYARPGREQSSGFLCSLDPQRGIRLNTDSVMAFATRASDLTWTGNIRFPFFGWQAVVVVVRNLIPVLKDPLTLTGVRPHAVTCTGVGQENAVPDPSRQLSVTARSVRYLPFDHVFTTNTVEALEITNDRQQRREALRMTLASFTSGDIELRGGAARDTVISANTQVSGNCVPHAVVRQKLLKYRPSTDMIDLVCYDTSAQRIRAIPGSCCMRYFTGTYCVTTQPSGGGSEDTLVTMPQTRWYPDVTPPLLDAHATRLQLSGEEGSSRRVPLDIPGIQLKIENSMLTGNFGATTTDIATSLPYEGECRFMLDLRTGYYFLQLGGTFTWGITFMGETFIVHAPMNMLRMSSGFDGVPPVLDDIAARMLFGGSAELESAMGVDGVDPCTVVTGILNGGGARFGYNPDGITMQISAAAGTAFLGYRQGGRSHFCIGTFLNGIGTASFKIVDFTAEVHLQFVSTSLMDAGSVDQFLRNTEFILRGRIHGGASVDLGLTTCEAGIDASGEYSVRKGFRIDEAGIYYGCD